MVRRHIGVALTWLVFAGACHGWRERDISTGIAPAVAGREDVRVTRSDGSSVRLDEPRVEGDSLTGQSHDASTRITLPVSDVRHVDSRVLSVGRTALLVGGFLTFIPLFSDH
jgi:hypothetical protein